MRLKTLLSKRIVLSPPPAMAAVVISSVLYLFAALYAQPGGFSDTISCMNKTGLWLYIVNWLPIIICSGLVYFASNNCALAVSLTGVVFGMLSIINYFKIRFRQSPLWPWDFTLGGEVAGIARSFTPSLIITLAALLVSMALFVVISAVFVRTEPVNAWVRVAGFGCLLAVTALCVNKIYAVDELYERAYVEGNRYNEADRFNSRGFVYSFSYVLASTRIEKPPGYDRTAAAAYLDSLRPQATAVGKKPHIIMIMSEAFSEIALNPELDYSGYTDPLKYYKQLKSRSFSGSLVVPNVGGGTADTEFDVLTGVNSRHYREVPYTFKLINKPTESLVTELAALGYANVAIHPGYSWFYNRASAFPNLGFSRFIHLADFDDKTQSKGGYINETATFDRLIYEFEEHVRTSDAPFFEFCVTIQNHGPYIDKYTGTSEPVPKNFETALELTELQLNAMYNYVLGLADADRELERLVGYLEASDEPVVLVYFGDHQPSLDFELYNKLLPQGEQGCVSNEMRNHHVPYIIWQNAAAGELAAPTAHETVSSAYLGALLLRALGFETAYFGYLAGVSDDYPIALETRYSTPDGALHEGDEPEALQQLRRLEYYRYID